MSKNESPSILVPSIVALVAGGLLFAMLRSESMRAAAERERRRSSWEGSSMPPGYPSSPGVSTFGSPAIW